MFKSSLDVTGFLLKYHKGDKAALEELISSLYKELHAIAKRQIFSSNREKTISPTVLVHELFISLEKGVPLQATNRRAFYSAVATSMRNLLIDYARKEKAEKRGGDGLVRVTLGEDVIHHSAEATPSDVERLNEALEKLALLDPELSQIVELRYLVGLSIEEAASTLQVSPRTIRRRWTLAKAWLTKELSN